MSNTQPPRNDWTAPLLDLEARFNEAKEFILKRHPKEDVGGFPSLEGIETERLDALGVLEARCAPIVWVIEKRADDLREEEDEVERVRAESQRRKNMTEDQAWREKIERILAYQGAEIAKLKGVQPGGQPAPSHVARADRPQFLVPGPRAGAGAASGGVRRVQAADGEVPASTPAAAQPSFTRKARPLDVLGSSGR
jgi:hypothetical protein